MSVCKRTACGMLSCWRWKGLISLHFLAVWDGSPSCPATYSLPTAAFSPWWFPAMAGGPDVPKWSASPETLASTKTEGSANDPVAVDCPCLSWTDSGYSSCVGGQNRWPHGHNHEWHFAVNCQWTVLQFSSGFLQTEILGWAAWPLYSFASFATVIPFGNSLRFELCPTEQAGRDWALEDCCHLILLPPAIPKAALFKKITK